MLPAEIGFMHTAFIHPDRWNTDAVELDPDESTHLIKSVRAREGDAVRLFDGCGRSALAKINLIQLKGKSIIAVRCTIEKDLPLREPSTKLTLIQALPKGRRMDFLIEKATELGVWEIVPVITERVEKQPGGKGYDGQVERWRRIALSAAKQCGSAWLPSIHPVSKLETVLEGRACSGGVFIVGVLCDRARSMSDCLESFGTGDGTATVLIGPEGDLTDGEIQLAEKAGAYPVTFGNLVLRVETAAIYAVSIMKYHFKWDVWK